MAAGSQDEMKRKALIQTHLAAIREIRESMNEENREAAATVISTYTRALQQLECRDVQASSLLKQEEDRIRLNALQAESRYVGNLIKQKRIDRDNAMLAQDISAAWKRR